MKKVFWNQKILSIGLAMGLAGTMAACGSANQATSLANNSGKAMGTLLLSVNPEIEVDYDEKGLVLELEGINEDGKNVLEGYADYSGKACKEVINELVEKIYEGGYFDKTLDGHAKNIVVKLEEGSSYPNERFLENVADSVRKVVQTHNGESAALVIGTDDLDAQGRIGIEKAREVALKQLGLSNAEFREGEYDLDDGVYELEFTVDGVKYEYEVNAVTGKVVEADRENNDDWDAWDDDKDDLDDDRDDLNDLDDDRDDLDDDRDDLDDDRDDLNDDRDDLNDDRDDLNDDRDDLNDDRDDLNDDRDDLNDDRDDLDDDRDDLNDDRDDLDDDRDDLDDDRDDYNDSDDDDGDDGDDD